MEATMEVTYIDRVKHVFSTLRTNDEELEFAQNIEEKAETIEISSGEEDDETKVITATKEGVYHFNTFRTGYIGHASRTLIELLQHFCVNLPIEFVVSHRTMKIYLIGDKIVVPVGNDEEIEYSIGARNGVYELVEPINVQLLSRVIDIILYWSEQWNCSQAEVIEGAILALAESFEAVAAEEEEVEKSNAGPENTGE